MADPFIDMAMHLRLASDHLVAANDEMHLVTNGILAALTEREAAHVEQEDLRGTVGGLRETVSRLERLVLELVNRKP